MTASVLPDLDVETVEELRPPCDCRTEGIECGRPAEWAGLIRCDACRRIESTLMCSGHHAHFFIRHDTAACRLCGFYDVPYTCLSAERL